MGAAEAYVQGGAALLLIVVVALVIRYLMAENKELKADRDRIIDASTALLNKYQDRDAEELKELRRKQTVESHQ